MDYEKLDKAFEQLRKMYGNPNKEKQNNLTLLIEQDKIDKGYFDLEFNCN